MIPNGVRIETCDLEHVVYTDRKWVCFMLGQLLQNAVRYRSGEPVVAFSAKSLGNLVQLVVSDNGIGIPSDVQDRVFDRFFRVERENDSREGAGLGLSIVKRVAEYHRGELILDSEEGVGTTVTLHL